jgi:tetratricopeptide (TPR) repeat protein
LAQSDAEEALVWFDQAIICDPEYPEAIFGKVNAYRAMGLEKEAFEWTQKASDMRIDGDEDE